MTVDTLSEKTVDDLRAIGLSAAKSQYILTITEAVRTGQIDLESIRQLSDEEVIAKLTSIRGIGSWTAKMFLLFVLKRSDILPHEDGAFLQSFMWLYCCKEKPNRPFIRKEVQKMETLLFYSSKIFIQGSGYGVDENAIPSKKGT